MTGPDRTASAPHRKVTHPGQTPLNTRVDWCSLLVIALGAHVILACVSPFVFSERFAYASVPKTVKVSLPCFSESVTMASERLEETEYEIYEVHEQEIIAAQPVIRDEEVAGYAETDDDLPYEESFGSSEGLSDGPFSGPSSNGKLGIGGGAGGSFLGRGGSCDLGTAGGGRRCGSTWKRSKLVPHTSRLKVGDKEALKLEGMHVAVRIQGFRARVRIDCFYRNDLGRDLEGRFQIRLPNEASPYYFAFGEMVREVPLAELAPKGGFALSVAAMQESRAGTWRAIAEARMVPKATAAKAYSEIARRRVDPALLEWSGADIFSARVSPLAAGKLHRVVLGYDVNLVDARCATTYQLDLPKDIPDLGVELNIDHPGAVVTPRGPAREGRHRFWNPAARQFRVRVPLYGGTMLKGLDPETGPYFGVRFTPPLPRQQAAPSPRAVFLVDTSASSNSDAYNIWLAMLESILERNRGSLREFAVGFFDLDVRWWRRGFVRNTPENVAALLQYARRRSLYGATDLSVALSAAASRRGDYDVFLLSDGASTWGEDDERVLEASLGRGHALFAYQTGLSGSDTRRLRALAQASGGAVFAVPGASQIPAAAVAHTLRPWHIDAVSLPGGTDLLLEGRPSEVYPGQSLLLVGRGLPPGRHPAVTLRLSRGAERRRIVTAVRNVIRSPLAPRLYGQVAVGQLEMFESVPAATAKAYAIHFRVVGATCSLLMLETEAQYAEFGIVPEDQAAVVRSVFARTAVAHAEDAGAAELAGAKGRFLTRLRKIQKDAGVPKPFPGELSALLDSIPAAAFDIRTEPLGVREGDDGPMREAYRDSLRGERLDYDIARRRAENVIASGHKGLALRVLSSLVEQAPGDIALLRDVAFQAQTWGYGGHAFFLLRRAAVKRPQQGQSLADMGACLAACGRTDAAIVCYEAALIRTPGARQADFRRCTLFAYAHLLSRIAAGEGEAALQPYAVWRLPALYFELGLSEADLVITIGWNTDRTDVDLYVEEPSQEKCSYNNRVTKSGGRMTQDVTSGFGPETYVIQDAPSGPYGVAVHYFSSDRLRASTRTRVWATLHRNFGRSDASMERLSLLLEKGKAMHPVAIVERKP